MIKVGCQLAELDWGGLLDARADTCHENVTLIMGRYSLGTIHFIMGRYPLRDDTLGAVPLIRIRDDTL